MRAKYHCKRPGNSCVLVLVWSSNLLVLASCPMTETLILLKCAGMKMLVLLYCPGMETLYLMYVPGMETLDLMYLPGMETFVLLSCPGSHIKTENYKCILFRNYLISSFPGYLCFLYIKKVEVHCLKKLPIVTPVYCILLPLIESGQISHYNQRQNAGT